MPVEWSKCAPAIRFDLATFLCSELNAGTSTLGQATTSIISMYEWSKRESGDVNVLRSHQISLYYRLGVSLCIIGTFHRKPSMWSYPQALLLTMKIKYQSKMSAFSCTYHVKICLYFFSLTLRGVPFPPFTHRPYINTSILHNHPSRLKLTPPPHILSPSPFSNLRYPLSSLHPPDL